MRGLLIIALASLSLLVACPGKQGARHIGDKPKEVVSANSRQAPSRTPTPPAKAVKQVILIYTGDTLSAMQPQVGQTPDGETARLGGISALTSGILNYQASITAMTRQRVLESGGDNKDIKTDAVKGILGEHPYLLLDYGGWERDQDPAGLPYVKLQMQMFKYMRYTAVAGLLWQQLSADEWQKYAGTVTVPLLASAGSPITTNNPVEAIPIVVREAHDAKWGVVAVPLPVSKSPDPTADYSRFIDAAAKRLHDSGCDYGILLCKGAPQKVYRALAEDKRFAVVIGAAPPALAVREGFGEIEPDRPIMLPQLNWGGQEFGTCHLIYPEKGNVPVQYNFVRHAAVDDMQSPLPYRKQASAAVAERKQLGGK